MLCAAIRLRYSEPNTDRPYRVPGGRVGIWIVGGMGLLGCVFGFVMGFIPPTGVKHWTTPVYIGAMVLGIVISTAPPFIIEKVKKRSWVMSHPDEVLVDVEGSSLGALDLEHSEPEAAGADHHGAAKLGTDGHDITART